MVLWGQQDLKSKKKEVFLRLVDKIPTISSRGSVSVTGTENY